MNLKSSKFTAFFGLFLLFFTTFIVAFHHHEGFEAHKYDCSVCLLSANLPSFAAIPLTIFLLFVFYFSIFIFIKAKPITSTIFFALGRAPPNSVTA
ncbi:MAG: hypothetical protein ACE14Q_02835 [Acidobacteriota bacterium]